MLWRPMYARRSFRRVDARRHDGWPKGDWLRMICEVLASGPVLVRLWTCSLKQTWTTRVKYLRQMRVILPFSHSLASHRLSPLASRRLSPFASLAVMLEGGHVNWQALEALRSSRERAGSDAAPVSHRQPPAIRETASAQALAVDAVEGASLVGAARPWWNGGVAAMAVRRRAQAPDAPVHFDRFLLMVYESSKVSRLRSVV